MRTTKLQSSTPPQPNGARKLRDIVRVAPDSRTVLPAVTFEPVATLLERERELAHLGKALTEAQQGFGQFVLVEAPAGLGKTSLLRGELSEAAAGRRFHVPSRARKPSSSAISPMAACASCSSLPSRKPQSTERHRLFEGGRGSFEATLRREAAPRNPHLPPIARSRCCTVSTGCSTTWRANAPLRRLQSMILHWSDTESLRFLNYLAPRLDGLPIAVVASMRTGQHVTADLARLCSAGGTRVLRPEPLSVEATAKLCKLKFGSEVEYAFAAACRDATGGNPFFLEALLREAKERRFSGEASDADGVRRLGPTAVARGRARAIVQARLPLRPRLCEPPPFSATEQVSSETARFGRTSQVNEAAKRRRPPDCACDLETRRTAGFAHPIVREAVYADIGSQRACACARSRDRDP